VVARTIVARIVVARIAVRSVDTVGAHYITPARTLRKMVRRVEFDPTSNTIYLLARFAHHTSHCPCCAPFRAYVKGDTLGERGHAYAGDVAQYVYSKAGKAYPVVDHNATDTRVQLDGVQDLPKAIGQGLKISSQKLSPVVSQDRTCSERMRLPERRDGYDVLEVVPRRRKERAKSGNWR
jgi:hypothetical protein